LRTANLWFAHSSFSRRIVAVPSHRSKHDRWPFVLLSAFVPLTHRVRFYG
jgi:hypothetical protein